MRIEPANKKKKDEKDSDANEFDMDIVKPDMRKSVINNECLQLCTKLYLFGGVDFDRCFVGLLPRQTWNFT